jgi:hypothetical protein
MKIHDFYDRHRAYSIRSHQLVSEVIIMFHMTQRVSFHANDGSIM